VSALGRDGAATKGPIGTGVSEIGNGFPWQHRSMDGHSQLIREPEEEEATRETVSPTKAFNKD
jgi:hypothetical protein